MMHFEFSLCFYELRCIFLCLVVAFLLGVMLVVVITGSGWGVISCIYSLRSIQLVFQQSCVHDLCVQNQKKTRFPEWHETLEFLLPSDTTYNNLSVIVTVWDKDRLSSDDFMGQVRYGTGEVQDQ